MPGPKKDLLEAGEAEAESRCEVCGRVGETVVAFRREPPHKLCLECVVEYRDSLLDDEE